MRIISEHQLGNRLGSLTVSAPRVVVSGNWSTPKRALEIVDANIETYRLFVLGLRHPASSKPSVRLESPFVGAGMRRSPMLDYIPMRLSLVPRLFAISRQPDVVILHTSTVKSGKVSLGIEVNVLPAAVEVARARGALVIAQLNPRMPYTFGEGELPTNVIDLAIEVDEPLQTAQALRPGLGEGPDRRAHRPSRAGRCDTAAWHRRHPRCHLGKARLASRTAHLVRNDQ